MGADPTGKIDSTNVFKEVIYKAFKNIVPGNMIGNLTNYGEGFDESLL